MSTQSSPQLRHNNGTRAPMMDYQALFEAVPGPFLVVMTDDPRFTIVAASEAFLQTTGQLREEVIGRAIFEVFPEGPDATHTDTIVNLRASFRRVIATRQPDTLPVQRYDLPRPEAEGDGMEERYWSSVNSPVTGPDGTVQFLIHRPEDVTELVRLKRREAEQGQLAETERGRADQFEAELFLRHRELAQEKQLSEERQRAASALKASEERFRLMGDAVPQIVWVTNARGRVEYFNRQWSNYTGAPHEPTTLADVAAQFVHPEDEPATLCAFKEAQRTGTTFTVEHRLRSASGEYHWFLARAEPYRDPGTGKIVRWFGASTDIDNLKQSETAVQASEAKYRALFESIDEGFCIIEMLFDGNGKAFDYRFLEANPAFERQTGLVGVIGRTIREFVPHLDEHWYQIYGRVALTGEPVRFENHAPAMGRWFDLYAFRTEAPEKHHVAVLFKDVTAQKAAEAERERLLQQIEIERQRLQLVFAQAPVGVCVLRGPELVYELANARYRELLPGRSVLGRPLLDAVPEIDTAIVKIPRQVLTTGEPFAANELLIPLDRDGDGVPEDSWFNLVCHPLREPDGTILSTVVVVIEVTAQVLARRELERINKELEEFAYVASHDLQEPLRMINIYTQLLLRRFVPDESEARECAGFIQDGVTRMESLIRDLLIHSRTVQAEELPAGIANLSAALSEAESVLHNLIEDSGAVIKTPELPAVRGTTQQFSLVFQNLLSNAIKYRRKGVPPRICISAERAGEQWIISVQDNGIGFEQQYAQRIFGLFKRLHKEEYPGTGLGLSICQRIVERYGGRMWAEGRPGEGATFFLALPPADAL